MHEKFLLKDALYDKKCTFAKNSLIKISETMNENDISYIIRGAIYKVYKELGPGLLESIYEAALKFQLAKDGLDVKTQVPIDVVYCGYKLPMSFRLDMLVQDKVIVELKSVENMREVYSKQLLSYLKMTDLHLGILVNFNVNDINNGIFRIVNKL